MTALVNPVKELFRDAKYAIIELDNGQKFVANVSLLSILWTLDETPNGTKDNFGGKIEVSKIRVMETK